MAEASPICRGKNLTIETILAFVNAMPTSPMKKSEFHELTEKRLKGWTQTHSQIARQVALYYEANGICCPRFTQRASYLDVLKYMVNWARLYYVPNLYTPSLNNAQNKPTNIYAFLKNMVLKGENSFSKACTGMFGIELNNTDKVRVYLNNFTDLVISDDTITINENILGGILPDTYPSVESLDAKEYFDYFKGDENATSNSIKQALRFPLQQIFYGAPGTGKSHTIKVQTKGEDVVRTTFHPDTDYSTFVGAYKPTTGLLPICDELGQPMKIGSTELKKEQIIYEFVEQAFLQAYVAAWKKYGAAGAEETPKNEYLIIEEINRGNCAQIFGDLFQLLDRGDEGFSEYPIKADADMKKQLAKEFAGMKIAKAESINTLFDGETDVVGKVLSGEILLLPNNLYIWATMNTSDQSLFPIDSAFKRRWDWQYVPIGNAEKGWTIDVNGNKYDWWQFLSAINDKVYEATYSEDKKLGYFFCKAKDGVITADKFVSKVIFYLWNDVFKDSEFEGDAFKDANGDKLSFDKFYIAEGNKAKVNMANVEQFLKNLGLEPIVEEASTKESE